MVASPSPFYKESFFLHRRYKESFFLHRRLCAYTQPALRGLQKILAKTQLTQINPLSCSKIGVLQTYA